jgi:hypothetical protein
VIAAIVSLMRGSSTPPAEAAPAETAPAAEVRSSHLPKEQNLCR